MSSAAVLREIRNHSDSDGAVGNVLWVGPQSASRGQKPHMSPECRLGLEGQIRISYSKPLCHGASVGLAIVCFRSQVAVLATRSPPVLSLAGKERKSE